LLWKRILYCFDVYTGVKVVSVSRTPGHTKHFQTIFLTSTVRLCDSPGLVFPSAVARPLQVYTDSVLYLMREGQLVVTAPVWTRDLCAWQHSYSSLPSHSQRFDSFPFPWDSRVCYSHSHGIPECAIPIPSRSHCHAVSSTVINNEQETENRKYRGLPLCSVCTDSHAMQNTLDFSSWQTRHKRHWHLASGKWLY